MMWLILVTLLMSILIGVQSYMACNHFKSGNYFWFGVFGTHIIAVLITLIMAITKTDCFGLFT